MPKTFTPRQDCQIKGLGGIYDEYFYQRTNGQFVEVGAFDGASYSNTVFLAECGWKGLYIEAHPEFAKVCANNHKDRPNVKVLSCAVGDRTTEVKLYEIGECSTVKWDKSAVDWGGSKERFVRVQMRKLDDILKEEQIEPDFELLIIDVEQAELEVLAGFDLKRWHPQMVIVETHEQDPAPERNWKARPIRKLFIEAGYRVIYTDAINSVFVQGLSYVKPGTTTSIISIGPDGRQEWHASEDDAGVK